MINTRITNKTLGTLCERVGIAFETGLDPYRIFDREASNARSQYGLRMRSVADHVREGSSLSDAIKAQGNYFPPHFAEMIEGGERSGRLDRVLERLAEYYQQLAEFRNTFTSSIVWPIIQLVLTIIIVGLLIYVPAVLLPQGTPEQQDLIGIGLVGERGLAIYLTIVGAVVVCIGILWVLGRRGTFDFVSDALAAIPILGRNLRVFAEARFVQTLALAIDSGLDAANAVELSFRSAGTAMFRRQSDAAHKKIMQGREIHAVMAETGLFQGETLEAIELGEDSGRLAETLDKHFRQLKSQVRTAMARITYTASALIWLFIAALLIMIIFRVFSMYINGLEERASEAAQMNAGR